MTIGKAAIKGKEKAKISEQSYLFEIVLMTNHHFDAPLLGCERSDVPDTERVIHRVRQYIGAIGTQGQARHCVAVALHFVEKCVLAQVPHLAKNRSLN